MFCKSARADDGIMAPIIAITSRPQSQTRRDHRTIDLRCKLLLTCKERVAIDDERQRLNDACIRISFHRHSQRKNSISRHEAISIQHNHMVVSCTPSHHEVGNIACLAARILCAVAIEDARMGA